MDNLSMIDDGSPKENVFRGFQGDVSAFGWAIALRLLFRLPVTVDVLLEEKELRQMAAKGIKFKKVR